MSSPEDSDAVLTTSDSRTGSSKKRKVIQRACDYCRRKKIKCDGSQMPNKRCTKCISRSAQCTYVEPFQKSSYPDSYVEDLERRLRHTEALLAKQNVGAKTRTTLHNDTGERSTPQSAGTEATVFPRASGSASSGVSALSIAPPTPPNEDSHNEDDLSDDDVAVQRDILKGITKLSIHPSTIRYHGKSSGWVFIQTAAGLRQEYIRNSTPPSSQISDRLPSGKRLMLINPDIKSHYQKQPWLERPFVDPLLSPDDFPPDELLHKLVDLYFRKYNDFTPLLHEPNFIQSIREGLHLRHGGFGATVLLACALGSRYSRDKRVLLDGTNSWRSAGWKWYQRVDDMHKSLLAPVQLYDLQICAMMSMFIQGTTAPQTMWVLIGVGIRKALDVGAHRKSMYKPQPSVEDELWRRAFWTLLFLEIWSSYGLGRPPSIHEEEYDVAFPTECDDEYWTNDDPALAFKQPSGKPSRVAAFVTLLRLSRIVAYALRTIFSIRKTRTQLGSGDQQWEERIVAQLDSELNKWVDLIPSHLKWNPHREDNIFLEQSATLYASYYSAQIAVHRSFITTRRESPHALASLIICTNAARSCIQVLHQLCQRIGSPLARNAGLLFSSGLVLLMSMWGQRRSGRHRSADKDQGYIQECIDMLQMVENEYHVAERLKDMLQSFLALDTPGDQLHAGTYSQSSSSGGANETPPAQTEAAIAGRSLPTQDLSAAVPRDDGVTPSQITAETTAHESDALYAATLAFARINEQSPDVSSMPHGPDVHATSNVPSTMPEAFQDAAQLFEGPFSMEWLPQYRVPSAQSSTTEALSAFTSLPQGTGFPSQRWGNISSVPGMYDASSDSSSPPTGLEQFAGTHGGAAGLSPPDWAFVDDTMSIWSNAPASFGWDDWDAYFNAVNSATQQPR